MWNGLCPGQWTDLERFLVCMTSAWQLQTHYYFLGFYGYCLLCFFSILFFDRNPFVRSCVTLWCVQVITDHSPNGQIIGMHYTGPNAGEVMQGYAVALR